MKIKLTLLMLLLTIPITSALPICLNDFIRGDADNSGSVNINDAVFILSYLFGQGQSPVCFDSADVKDDESISIADATFLLGYLFPNGNSPNNISQPFPNAGTDEICDGINNDNDAHIDEGCPYSTIWNGQNSQSQVESIEQIIKATDGTFWAVGNNNTHILVSRFHNNGTQIAKYGYNYSGITKGYGITQYPNGFAIVGETNNHGLVLKIDNSGNLIMSNIYQNSPIEKYNEIILTSDGNFLIGGRGYGYALIDQENVWVMKTNFFGGVLWSKNISNVGFDEIRSLVETSNSYVAGGVLTNSGTQNAFAMWMSKNSGNIVWNDSIYGVESEINNLYNDNGVVYGIGTKQNANKDIMVVNIISNGINWNLDYDFGVNEKGIDIAKKGTDKLVLVGDYESGGLHRLAMARIQTNGLLIDWSTIEKATTYIPKDMYYETPFATIGGGLTNGGYTLQQIFI